MERITAKEAAAVLKENGIIVTVAEAEEVLVFLRLMAGMIVSNYLKENSYGMKKSELRDMV
jgi:hypothetical protein